MNMKAMLAVVALASTLSLPATEAAPPRPNVLILFGDDQRADTIAALGNPVIKTPNLDRLVRRGVSFDRACMQGGFNPATCVPSRAMLLTGRSLFHVEGKRGNEETWPEAFGRAGYTTFVSGKWHNSEAMLVDGFRVARSMFVGGMTNPLHARVSDVVDGRLGPPRDVGKHACEVFADETIRFLREHEGGPFFAYVPFNAPHDPHVTPPDFPVRYDPAAIPLPPSFLPQHPWDNGEMTIRDEALLPWPRTPENVRHLLADYYRYVSYLDLQVGRVLDALEASPHAQNTLVVFSADSGVARGSHGLVGKQNLYHLDSVRVPLVIGGPGVPESRRSDALVYLYDLLPTLGGICGVTGPAGSEGIDFSGSVRDPEKPARRTQVFAYRGLQRAICDDRWKLIRYPQVDRTQLFDLRADPHEASNLAGEPAQAGKVAELMAMLERELRTAGDDARLTVAKPKPADWSPPTRKGGRMPKS